MPVGDRAGFHVAKMDYVHREVFECVTEAIAATRRREGIRKEWVQVIHNEERDSVSISLGNPEAKRAFESTCDDLADENPDLADVFTRIREETIDAIKATRQAHGLGAYEDTPGDDI